MKILILAESGFGKTSSIVENKELGIKGVDPKESYVITCTNKMLPLRHANKIFPTMPKFSQDCTPKDLKDYRRIVIVGNPPLVAHAISLLGHVPTIKNIILDDTNYIMQDYYMAKALSTGWDAPKRIGYDMGRIFNAISILPEEKNFFMLAHGEEYEKVDGRRGYRMKTTGRMVAEYITPEGKFEVTLIGRSYYDDQRKMAVKQFVTNDDGVYTSAKSPYGLFDDLYIPNDLGYVVKKIKEFQGE